MSKREDAAYASAFGTAWDEHGTRTDIPPEPMTDGDKLRLLALWFDMWDRPETDRQAILDDDRNPGKNEVQEDLRRIADKLDRLREERAHAL